MINGDNSDYEGFEFLIPTVDGFGVPSSMLGPHSEPFFQMLGRIVALSALLEYRLLTLCQVLTHSTQDRYTNLWAKQLIDEIRKELRRLREPGAVLIGQFLDAAAGALSTRNDYAHNLWPAQSPGHIFGWRPAKPKGGDGTITTTKTLAEMADDVAVLVRLLDAGRWAEILLVAKGREPLVGIAGDEPDR